MYNANTLAAMTSTATNKVTAVAMTTCHSNINRLRNTPHIAERSLFSACHDYALNDHSSRLHEVWSGNGGSQYSSLTDVKIIRILVSGREPKQA